MDVKEQTQRMLGLVNELATRGIELPRAVELETGQVLVDDRASQAAARVSQSMRVEGSAFVIRIGPAN